MLVYILCNVTILYLIVNCHGYVVFVVSFKIYTHIKYLSYKFSTTDITISELNFDPIEYYMLCCKYK